MSALYGRMQGERSEVTRTAHHEIVSKLETWHGQITTELDRDGNFGIYIGSKETRGTLVFTGNVNDGQRNAVATVNVDKNTACAYTVYREV
jgi:hypothetical protein